MSIDHTHDPDLNSWVPEANDHPDFPIQNLPFARCSYMDREFIAVGIGYHVLDLSAAFNFFDESMHADLQEKTLNRRLSCWAKLSLYSFCPS